MLRRAIFIPAPAIRCNISNDSVSGPIVQIILVFIRVLSMKTKNKT